MGKHKEDIEAKLRDIQGHTIYLPYDDVIEQVVPNARRPMAFPWSTPERLRNDFSHRRMWTMSAENTEEKYAFFENLRGAVTRTHQISFGWVANAEQRTKTINDFCGLQREYGYTGRITAYSMRDGHRVFVNPVTLGYPGNRVEPVSCIVDGIDGMATWWTDGEWSFRRGNGFMIGLPVNQEVRFTAHYFSRDVLFDAEDFFERWAEEVEEHGYTNPWGQGVAEVSRSIVLAGSGEWLVARGGRVENTAASVAVPLDMIVKHGDLIKGLKKSIKSGDWSQR